MRRTICVGASNLKSCVLGVIAALCVVADVAIDRANSARCMHNDVLWRLLMLLHSMAIDDRQIACMHHALVAAAVTDRATEFEILCIRRYCRAMRLSGQVDD